MDTVKEKTTQHVFVAHACLAEGGLTFRSDVARLLAGKWSACVRAPVTCYVSINLGYFLYSGLI